MADTETTIGSNTYLAELLATLRRRDNIRDSVIGRTMADTETTIGSNTYLAEMLATLRRRDNIRDFVIGLHPSECWPYPEGQNGHPVAAFSGNDLQPKMVYIKPMKNMPLRRVKLESVTYRRTLVNFTIKILPELGPSYCQEESDILDHAVHHSNAELEPSSVRDLRSALLNRYEWVNSKVSSVNYQREKVFRQVNDNVDIDVSSDGYQSPAEGSEEGEREMSGYRQGEWVNRGGSAEESDLNEYESEEGETEASTDGSDESMSDIAPAETIDRASPGLKRDQSEASLLVVHEPRNSAAQTGKITTGPDSEEPRSVSDTLVDRKRPASASPAEGKLCIKHQRRADLAELLTDIADDVDFHAAKMHKGESSGFNNVGGQLMDVARCLTAIGDLLKTENGD